MAQFMPVLLRLSLLGSVLAGALTSGADGGAPAPLLRRTAKGFSTFRTGTGKVTPRGTHSRSKTNTHR